MNLSLADLLCAPERVAEVEPEAARAMLVQLGGLVVTLSARLATAPDAAPSENGDQLLTIEEASTLLGVDRQWLWRRSRRADWKPFTVRLSRKCLRLKEPGLRRWMAQQGAR